MLSHGRYLSVRASRWCQGDERFQHVELADARLADRIRANLQRHALSAVVPAGIGATLYLAQHRDAFPADRLFPLSEHALLAQLNDKWAFHQLMTDLGKPQPRTVLVGAPDDLDRVEVGEPIVVKPLAGQGGQGVVVLQDRDALVRHVSEAAAADRLPLLVQEFLPGIDQGASAVVDHGRVVGLRIQRGASSRVLDYVDDPEISDVVAELVAAVGFHGVLNVDFRRDERDGSVVATECNPRLFSSAHMAARSGFNPLELGLRLMSRPGMPAPAPPGPARVMSSIQGVRSWLGNQPLSPETRHLLGDEMHDPFSSAFRRVENALLDRRPTLGAWLVDEPLASEVVL